MVQNTEERAISQCLACFLCTSRLLSSQTPKSWGGSASGSESFPSPRLTLTPRGNQPWHHGLRTTPRANRLGVCGLACCWSVPQFPHCYLRFCITEESSGSSVLTHLGEHGVWAQRDKVTGSNPQASFKQLSWGSLTFENSLRFLYQSFATCLSLTHLAPLSPLPRGHMNLRIQGHRAFPQIKRS